MDFDVFRHIIPQQADHEAMFQFASGRCNAPHFHVTEVGNVSKDFVDFGGTHRSTQTCGSRRFVGHDTDHRLTAVKLSNVLKTAATLSPDGALQVELEVQSDRIGVYVISGGFAEDGKLRYDLAAKRSACLDPQKCGLDVLPVVGNSNCRGETVCC